MKNYTLQNEVMGLASDLEELCQAVNAEKLAKERTTAARHKVNLRENAIRSFKEDLMSPVPLSV